MGVFLKGLSEHEEVVLAEAFVDRLAVGVDGAVLDVKTDCGVFISEPAAAEALGVARVTAGRRWGRCICSFDGHASTFGP